MNEQLLKQMEHAVYSNNLQFMSFRGRLMRVVDIALAYGEPQAVIRLRGVTAEDQRPNKWRGVEPEWIPWLFLEAVEGWGDCPASRGAVRG